MKSRGGSSTWERIAAQSLRPQAARLRASVVCGDADEPPQPLAKVATGIAKTLTHSARTSNSLPIG